MIKIVRFASSFALLGASFAANAQNLVVNGDFSAGRTSFSSGLSYAVPATDALLPEGVYTLVTNTRTPFVLNTVGIANYNEHTTGSGLAMFINGATTGSPVAWSQTVPGLVVGQSYRFSTFVSRWTPNQGAAALLSMAVGGVTVASFSDPATPGVWVQQSGLFIATSTSATFQILNSQQAGIGNDFGLDDISVTPVPEPAMAVVLGLGTVATLRRRPRSVVTGERS